jgi:hypothetical protein
MQKTGPAVGNDKGEFLGKLSLTKAKAAVGASFIKAVLQERQMHGLFCAPALPVKQPVKQL